MDQPGPSKVVSYQHHQVPQVEALARHSSSDSNQNSQSQEIHEDGNGSNGLPSDQRERSDVESRADSQNDPNLSGESQAGGDDETKTEVSNDGDQSDFH
jgi:hypothetical protein